MSKGLGDVIANITDSLGIKKCKGCERRQNALNNLFPFKSHYELTQDDKEFIAEFLQWYKGLPIPIERVKDIQKAEQIWLRIFKVKTGACKSCGVQYQNAFIKDLTNLYYTTLDNKS